MPRIRHPLDTFVALDFVHRRLRSEDLTRIPRDRRLIERPYHQSHWAVVLREFVVKSLFENTRVLVYHHQTHQIFKGCTGQSVSHRAQPALLSSTVAGRHRLELRQRTLCLGHSMCISLARRFSESRAVGTGFWGWGPELFPECNRSSGSMMSWGEPVTVSEISLLLT